MAIAIGILVAIVFVRHLDWPLRAMADKFQAPVTSVDNVDSGKMKKLAQRVEQVLTSDILFVEPKQLDPDLVLVAPNNRDGGPPNKMHLHSGILKSFKLKGFDRTRPHFGICILFTSEKGLKELIEHNIRFSKGCKRLPPIKEGAMYGSLAASHFNLALRCIKNSTFSPIGNLRDLLEDSANLKEVVTSGHRWWVLPETVLKERQVDISLWRNMDQNENQNSHEMEILGGIKATAEVLSKTQPSVKQADLMATAVRRNPTKVSSKSMMTLCHLYIGFLSNGVVDLVTELIDYHSEHVDPKELAMSIQFISSVCAEAALSKCPHVRLGLLQLQYNTEKTRANSSGPCFGAFLEPTNITSLCKKGDVLGSLETKIRELKSMYLPILERSLSVREARLEMANYVCLILRCLFSKPWPAGSTMPLKLGNFSEDKIRLIGVQWAKSLDLKYPEFNFAEASGLAEEPKEDDEPDTEVDLRDLRTLKKVSSEGPDPDLGPKFSRGDEVTVIRRFTWTIPQKGQPKYRKDLVEGMEGTIEGFADMENRLVLLKVKMDVPDGKNKKITKEAYPRNLKLTSEYNLQQAASKEPESEASSGQGPAKRPRIPDHIKGDSQDSSVVALKSFKEFLSDQDKNLRLMYLRSRIGVSLQALCDSLPTYNNNDFVVVARKNDRGLWKSEVWTKRAFEPLEIQFGPFSSQLKDTHLMASAHAVLHLPKHGRGSHPENQAMALDGRGRNLMAPKGLCDTDEHAGSFFWMVTRTSKVSEANMILENATFEQTLKVTLPAPKRRKTTNLIWEREEMPSVPILVNKAKIEKDKQLLTFLAEKRKEP